MKFLSTRRRHPLAGLVVMVLGLVLMGGLYSAFRPAAADDAATDTALISQGRRLFVASCSSCHGLNAEGILSKNGTNFGPSLVGVGAASVDFQVSTGRMPMARPDAQAPVKKNLYTEEEIAALAAYVASLAPGPAIPTPEEYDPANVSEEDIARGGELFRTNCSACHNFQGSGGALPGGKYAPTLIGVEPRHVYQAMQTGPQQMPVFSDQVLQPQDKRDVIAYLKSIEEHPRYGGAELGSYGPVSEGTFAWIVGIGGCVLFAIWIASHTARAARKGAKA